MRRTTLGFAALTVFMVTLSVFCIWLVVHDPINDALNDGAKGQEYPQKVSLSVQQAYGDEWVSLAVICPYEPRAMAEERIGIDGLDVPELGPREDENIVVLIDAKERFETVTYTRDEMEWCTGFQQAHLQPVEHLEFTREAENAPWVLKASS